MLDWIKEGEKGPWKIEHFEITKNTATIYAIGHYGSYAIAPRPGMYTRLIHKNRGVVMSDTRQELYDLHTLDHLMKLSYSRTMVIMGLGLGIFTKYALDKDWRVDVIEIDQDVIDLVGQQLGHYTKLSIIHDDALKYRPTKRTRYGVVWGDIWDNVTTDNWEEYKLLSRRWAHYADVQGYWGKSRIQRMLREDSR